VVWRWELPGEAFGNDRPNEDPDGDGIAFVFDLRYPGQQYDSATGFSYNYFRDYEPGIGRYVQSDQIGLLGGVTTYSYANSNPFTVIDRYGLAGDCPGCASDKPRFKTSRGAARRILRHMNPVSAKFRLEICGLICEAQDGTFFFMGPLVGLVGKCNPVNAPQCPACSKRAVAFWHTHPGNSDSFFARLFEARYDSENFSRRDMDFADHQKPNGRGLDGYLATPSDQFLLYPHGSRRQQNFGAL
jgi:RHS repeat-associated protein